MKEWMNKRVNAWVITCHITNCKSFLIHVCKINWINEGGKTAIGIPGEEWTLARELCDHQVHEKQRETLCRKWGTGSPRSTWATVLSIQGTGELVPTNISPNSHSLFFSELFSKPKLESSATHLDQGEDLNLWCSIPGAPPANFTIQKGSMTVSQTQNFTKRVSEWDSGLYTCVAGVGRVFKRSNTVQITVCGEYVLTGPESLWTEWEKGNLSPATTFSSLTMSQTEAG